MMGRVACIAAAMASVARRASPVASQRGHARPIIPTATCHIACFNGIVNDICDENGRVYQDCYCF